MPKTEEPEEPQGQFLHVTHMDGFELAPPPANERPQTVWHMNAAADDEAKSTKKTKQSASVAAAEQEK